MKTEVERCPHCNQEMRKYWHSLTPGLVNGLVKFAKAVGAKHQNSVHLRHDMEGHDFELTRDEWSNFSKLRMHGMVAKDKDAGAGYWLLTPRGASFLKGDLAVPSKVQTFNNVVEDHGGDMIFLRDVYTQDVPHFEGIQDIRYEVVPVELKQASFF